MKLLSKLGIGKIFISYRRKSGDKLARLLRETLTQRGYNVIFDRENIGSGPLSQSIQKEIKSSRDFLLLLTKDSLIRCSDQDDWVRLEIEYALKLKKNIIPVVDKGEYKEKSFPWPHNFPNSINQLRDYKRIDFIDDDFDVSIGRVIRELNSNTLINWIRIFIYFLLIIGMLWLGIYSIDLYIDSQRDKLVELDNWTTPAFVLKYHSVENQGKSFSSLDSYRQHRERLIDKLKERLDVFIIYDEESTREVSAIVDNQKIISFHLLEIFNPSPQFNTFDYILKLESSNYESNVEVSKTITTLKNCTFVDFKNDYDSITNSIKKSMFENRPIQGQIERVHNGNIEINIGRWNGVYRDMRLALLTHQRTRFFRDLVRIRQIGTATVQTVGNSSSIILADGVGHGNLAPSLVRAIADEVESQAIFSEYQ